MVKVANLTDLTEALNDKQTITLTRNIISDHSLTLKPDVILQGKSQEDGSLPTLLFTNSDGVTITKNNTIKNLNISTTADKRAIQSYSPKKHLGEFLFENLQINGQFSFITNENNLDASIKLDNIHVQSADTRSYLQQPQKYGVNVLQGALTIYNYNPDVNSTVKVKADNISAGQKNDPVTGSGIFIGGFGDTGGKVDISTLNIGSVYSTGRIPFGVADYITGGVFISTGTHAKKIVSNGPTTTYGVNDMVLDNWGTVDQWLVKEQVTSYGPSGVGFVNFGDVDEFTATAAIKTFGLGARGYNQYDGSLNVGKFKEVSTFGHGAVAIQTSKQINQLTVDGNVTTHGSLGNSLVKGVNVVLPAFAISVKENGHINKLHITGNIETYGNEVSNMIVDKDGTVDKFNVDGKMIVKGNNSNSLDIKDGGSFPEDAAF